MVIGSQQMSMVETDFADFSSFWDLRIDFTCKLQGSTHMLILFTNSIFQLYTVDPGRVVTTIYNVNSPTVFTCVDDPSLCPLCRLLGTTNLTKWCIS